MLFRSNSGDIGDLGLIPGSGRSPGEGNGNPLQHSCLENPMDRGACSPWGCKELDTTEQLSLHCVQSRHHWLTYLKGQLQVWLDPATQGSSQDSELSWLRLSKCWCQDSAPVASRWKGHLLVTPTKISEFTQSGQSESLWLQ